MDPRTGRSRRDETNGEHAVSTSPWSNFRPVRCPLCVGGCSDRVDGRRRVIDPVVVDAPRPPADRAGALLAQARSWAGRPVSEVGSAVAGKGGVGQRLEAALGLHPRFDDVDDPTSGVELKTLPFAFNVAGRARVQQSTFLTSASLMSLAQERWDTSRVKKKLTRVLFVPVEVKSARIGSAFLYEPDDADTAALRADWEDLADLVVRGLGFAITGRRGRWLQLRPKAKNAATTTQATTVDGDDIVLRPQGFYLRSAFTQRLLDERFPG